MGAGDEVRSLSGNVVVSRGRVNTFAFVVACPTAWPSLSASDRKCTGVPPKGVLVAVDVGADGVTALPGFEPPFSFGMIT
jgi:hypothetical protein